MAGASNVKGHHAEWMALLEPTGPFLSIPVLQATFPQGLDDVQPEVRATLRAAFEEWQEQTGGASVSQKTASSRKVTDAHRWHRAWIRHVITAVLGYSPGVLAEGATLPPDLTVTDRETGERRQPTVAVLSPGADRRAQLLIAVAPPGVALERLSERVGGGPASTVTPVDALVDLLRATAVPVGLVTNGETWIAVRQAPDAPVGLAHFSVPLFFEEPLTLRAFVSLFGQRRLLAVSDDETLSTLYTRSAGDLHEVADQLGRQVRHAIEVLLQALERADRDSGRTLLAGWDDAQLYEAALTVMMRLVFLFFAEEQDPPQLPMEREVYAKHYAASTLRAQLREHADKQGEEVLERRTDAWARLLATFRAVFGGVTHDQMRLVAHGGALFNPDRFPFLEGRAAGTSFRDTPARPLPIDNRATLHLLEALQILREAGGGEPRRLSFRGLDVEQIGTIYEGLLDHKAARAPEATLGLRGSAKTSDPNVTLAVIEAAAARPGDALVSHLHEITSRSESALRKALADVPSVGSPDEGRLRVACQNDEALLARVRPFAGLLRFDTLGLPVVWPKGAIHVAQGQERRQTGTHYTPQSLAAEVVRYALEPLIYTGPRERLPPDEWTLKGPRELLALRICDPAMGSGAFLVQVCRQLSDALVRAWGPVESGAPRTLPYGEPSGGAADAGATAELLELDPEARRMQARRLVADRCLYGVDKNPLAAEMAKLSLWLLTLRQGMPFTFLNHALQAGDSLLGLASLSQLERLSLSERDAGDTTVRGELPLLTGHWNRVLDAALAQRRRLIALNSSTVAHVGEKEALLQASDAQLAALRAVGDLVAGAALASTPEGRSPDELLKADDELLRMLFAAAERLQTAEHALEVACAPGGTDAARVQAAFEVKAAHRGVAAAVAVSSVRSRSLLQEGAAPEHGVRRPFHWVLAFPEVLLGDRPGFDVIIGNPPFIGGKKITGPLGVDYREVLVEHVGGGVRGHADICAYFFRRAGALVADGGVFGLLATNTIAKGDTREVGLDLLAGAGTIYRALPSRKWPGDANLEIAEVWWQKGAAAAPSPTLSDVDVVGISPFLVDQTVAHAAPGPLERNAGLAFIGSYVLGLGFTMAPDEAERLIQADPWNSAVLQPYMNGEDINRDPEQRPSRWVINFRDWSEDWAAAWVSPYQRVVERVKPERDILGLKSDASALGYARKWWQFGRRGERLYQAIRERRLTRVLARPRVTDTHAPHFLAPSMVYSEAVVVFASQDDWFFALLQSNFHEVWLRSLASSMRTDVRYTPSDCFDTFPFPHADPRTPLPALDAIGERYHAHRQTVMRARQLGLTKTYNLFHNPACEDADIADLRALHVALDTAVRDAYDAALKADGGETLRKEYGFAELDLEHGFHPTKAGTRYTVSEAARRGILDRLLRLNRARAAAEAVAKDKGEAPKKPKTPRAPKAPPPSQIGIPVQGVLFGAVAPVQSSLFDLAPADTTGDTEQVRRALAAAGPAGLTRADLTARAALPEDRARAALDALLAAGQAVREGQAKGTRYRLTGSANA